MQDNGLIYSALSTLLCSNASAARMPPHPGQGSPVRSLNGHRGKGMCGWFLTTTTAMLIADRYPIGYRISLVLQCIEQLVQSADTQCQKCLAQFLVVVFASVGLSIDHINDPPDVATSASEQF